MRLVRSLLALAFAFVLSGAPASAATPASDLTVVFVGGYGSDLASATTQFAPLRAALVAQHPATTFVQFSYAGPPAGCAAATPAYTAADTMQDLAASQRQLLSLLTSLHTDCGATHIAVIGHSLGGLLAFQALAASPVDGVTDLITVDSPLGGTPTDVMQTCVGLGLCNDGPVVAALAALNSGWTQTAADNAARAARLAQAGVRLSAWGNQSDCLYAVEVCLPFARDFLLAYDAGETQWLGIPNAVRRNYPPADRLADLLATHSAVLLRAAGDIAASVLS